MCMTLEGNTQLSNSLLLPDLISYSTRVTAEVLEFGSIRYLSQSERLLAMGVLTSLSYQVGF
jgi:hypothetical protein